MPKKGSSQYSHLLKPISEPHTPIKLGPGTSQPHVIQLHPPQKEPGAGSKGSSYEVPVKRLPQAEQVVTAEQFQAQANNSGMTCMILLCIHLKVSIII